jgi:hypothetical protein
MQPTVYRYTFPAHVPLGQVEAALAAALASAVSLHGEARVRLDAGHFLDRGRRACAVDAGTPVGADLNRLFVGELTQALGADAFRVERADGPSNPKTQEART